MKKFEMVLFMVFLLVLVTAGSIIPNQALAINDGDSLLVPEGIAGDDLIMEQNGGANDGTSGDPDSIGDGFEWGDDSSLLGLASGFIDGFEATVEEYIYYLMKQIDPLQ